jgi:hypothetical protein
MGNACCVMHTSVRGARINDGIFLLSQYRDKRFIQENACTLVLLFLGGCFGNEKISGAPCSVVRTDYIVVTERLLVPTPNWSVTVFRPITNKWVAGVSICLAVCI